MRDEGTIGAFLTGFTQVHVRKDKESKPLMSSVIYKSMYLGFWRDVSMSIRLIPTNSIRVILAYWLKCTCWCQSRVWCFSFIVPCYLDAGSVPLPNASMGMGSSLRPIPPMRSKKGNGYGAGKEFP